MMTPAISVIVPIYNTIQYLKHCVDSILRQSFQDLEIILVDDGSTDGSGALCDQYRSKHENIIVIHKQNAGLGYARNSGIDAASGKYLAFVDSDDFVDGDFLYKLYTAAEKSDADCAVAGCTVVYAKKEVRSPCTTAERRIGADEMDDLLLGSFGSLPSSKKDAPYGMSVWARLYRRELIEREHIRFVSEREYISEDILFNIDFLRHAKRAVLVPDVSYHYICTNPFSLSSVYRSDRIETDLIFAKYLEKKLQEIFPRGEYMLYWQRFLMMRIGYDIVQEVRWRKSPHRIHTPEQAIRRALSDDTVQRALAEYPWRQLPFLRRILVGAMRLANPRLLILLIRIQQYF